MGSPNDHPVSSPCVLLELLRRTLILVEFYGPFDADESTLSELKAALNHAIQRLDAKNSAEDAGSLRKGPQGETINTVHLDKGSDREL